MYYTHLGYRISVFANIMRIIQIFTVNTFTADLQWLLLFTVIF